MELLVLIIAGIIGFLLISALMNRKPAAPNAKAQTTSQEAPKNAAAPTEADQVVAACKTLGVEPPLNAEKLQAAYRAQIAQYHPDRVSGLGPDLQALANQKSAEINAAYTLLKRYL